MPIASATTANIGTPRTNAANMRCTSAAIHTAPRAPMPGNSVYDRIESAAAVIKNKPSAIRRYLREKRPSLREIDGHRVPDFAQQLDRDFARALAPRERFH